MDTKNIKLAAMILLSGVMLLSFLGCNDVTETPARYILTMNDYEVTEIKRPGTTGVRITPPIGKPKKFEWKSGSPIFYHDLLNWGGEKITISFEVPAFPGPVQNVKVTAFDQGLKNFVKDRVSTWSYTQWKKGPLTMIIYPMGKYVVVDDSGLVANYNGDPLVGGMHHVK